MNDLNIFDELGKEVFKSFEVIGKEMERVTKLWEAARTRLEGLGTASSDQSVWLDVPHLHQHDNRWYRDCGAACVAMILSWKGVATSVDEASALCGKRDNLNLPMWKLVAGLRKKGVRGKTITAGLDAKMIKAELDKGNPVIILLEYDDLPARYQAHIGGDNDFWHFVLVTSYDDSFGVFEINDPLHRMGPQMWDQGATVGAMNGDMNGAKRQGVVIL